MPSDCHLAINEKETIGKSIFTRVSFVTFIEAVGNRCSLAWIRRMPKFVKRPVVIDALQWTGDNLFEVTTFIEGKFPELRTSIAFAKWDEYCQSVAKSGLRIKTLEDGPDAQVAHYASVGDWIIKGVRGEFYPCKPEIFTETYMPADVDSGQQS